MKSLLKYLGKYKKESVLGPLFKLLEASFELLIPIVVARIVDVGIKSRDMNYILKMKNYLILAVFLFIKIQLIILLGMF